MWEKLKEAKNKNYVICAGTRKFGLWDCFGINLGLVSCHAYTMINIYDKIIDKEHYQLVKLRNPWGEKEFNGDWSDKSSKWTKELKKQFEFTEVKDDGIFYMCYKDFLYYFKFLEILKIEENYKIMASCKISKANAYRCQIISFMIKENNQKILFDNNIKVFINLYQKNPRIIRKNGSYYPNPVKSFIILARKESEVKYTYIKSITGTKFHLALEADLKVGEVYYIFCDVNYRFIYDEVYGYNITFYSVNTNEIVYKNITNELNGKKRANLLNRVLYNFYNNNINQFEKRDNRNIEAYKLKYYNETFPFIILLLKNKDKTKKRYYTLQLNIKSKEKNVCIYNDFNASEFDSYVIKQITNGISVILLMGYTLSDVFSFSSYVTEKEQIITHPIFKIKPKKEGNINNYLSIENNKGFILGFENIGNKDVNLNIEFTGLNIINPEYDIFHNENNNNEIIKDINMKKGEKKVFNLRIKPGYDKFDYIIF